ncbi:META domain-containing protein [Sulfitobacter sp. PS-8MA]|uniref:META domain-containing protein n=1 Tax=Sulfitobacter sp. PS-8MA TaxID=3237707 RepID=UPI0034C5DE04
MRMFLILASLVVLPQCQSDGTPDVYGDSGTTWQLTTLNGEAVTARATLMFPEAGQIAGKAPCNSFSGPLTADFPAFETGPIAATRMACPDLALETAFLNGLDQATTATVDAGILTLSNDSGATLVFKAAD